MTSTQKRIQSWKLTSVINVIKFLELRHGCHDMNVQMPTRMSYTYNNVHIETVITYTSTDTEYIYKHTYTTYTHRHIYIYIFICIHLIHMYDKK